MGADPANTQPGWTMRDRVKVSVLVLVLIMFSTHYYPDQIGRSIRETFANILWFSAFSGAVTLVLVWVLSHLEKAELPKLRVVKIFLVVAIAFGTIHQVEGCLKHAKRLESQTSQHRVCPPYVPDPGRTCSA